MVLKVPLNRIRTSLCVQSIRFLSFVHVKPYGTHRCTNRLARRLTLAGSSWSISWLFFGPGLLFQHSGPDSNSWKSSIVSGHRKSLKSAKQGRPPKNNVFRFTCLCSVNLSSFSYNFRLAHVTVLPWVWKHLWINNNFSEATPSTLYCRNWRTCALPHQPLAQPWHNCSDEGDFRVMKVLSLGKKWIAEISIPDRKGHQTSKFAE